MQRDASTWPRRWVANLVRALLLNGVWLLFALPIVSWLTASVAMVHSLDRWLVHGDDRVLHTFLAGWCRHWRRTWLVGIGSTFVLAALVINLSFLSTRHAASAVVLLMGTVTLMLMWAVLHLSLVPVIVLFPQLPVRQWLRESFILAFRHPMSGIAAVVCCVVVGTALLRAFEPLVVLVVVLSGYLALKLCYRHMEVAK